MLVPRRLRLVAIGVAAAWLIAAAAIGTVLVVALSSALS
jgi:hypothetical protein